MYKKIHIRICTLKSSFADKKIEPHMNLVHRTPVYVQKSPYKNQAYLPKEPCVSTKEPCVSTKEPSKEPCTFTQKVLYVYVKNLNCGVKRADLYLNLTHRSPICTPLP